MEEKNLEQEQKIEEILKITKAIEKMSFSSGWKYVKNMLEGQIDSLKEKIINCNDNELINIRAEIKSCRKLLDIVSYSNEIRRQLLEDEKKFKNELTIDKID